MSFSSHIQGKAGTSAASNSVSVVLGAAPTLGNTVCIAVTWFDSTTFAALSSVIDNNGNAYQITPNSPSAAQQATSGRSALAYLLQAPSNASATIKATFGAAQSGTNVIFADEFSYTGGTPFFDKDIAGSGAAGHTINTPTLAPTNVNSLLYCVAACQNSVTQVVAPWVEGGATVTGGNDTAYILSQSTSQAMNMAQAAGTHWDSMIMSLYISSAVAPVPAITLLGAGRS